jgi:lysophospholipid acyltransferase (LPLAT)-like uncharacterized protein
VVTKGVEIHVKSLGVTLKQLRRKVTYSPFFINLMASLATVIIRLHVKTLKIKRYYHPDFFKLDRNKVFYGFWHGNLYLLIPSFRNWNIAVMTDLSWSGAIITQILIRFGYPIVRGSSRRKGVQALLNMKRSVEVGCAGGIALDGPRGPLFKSKPGILFLAEKFKYPIVPFLAGGDRVWQFKTWDRFFLPKPFSRCYVAVGKPIHVNETDSKVTPEELDRIMMEWTRIADHKLKKEEKQN